MDCLCALMLLIRKDLRGRPYIRKSELLKAIEALPNLKPLVDELLKIGALVEERAGRGSRYLVLVERLFERFLEEAAGMYAGPTGYAPLDRVAAYVSSRMGISREEFEAMFKSLVRKSRKLVLTEGGAYKISIDGKSYGFVKLIGSNSTRTPIGSS